MNSFLERIAVLFINIYGSEVSKLNFVFPNRRAGIFFRNALGLSSEVPIFSPTILTIEECFEQFSNLKKIDKIELLFKTYQIYKEISNSTETFDEFVYWGEMLLNDFNEIDKYLVNAEMLFKNIEDLKKIDQLFDYFTPNQKETIDLFWNHFEKGKEIKSYQNFLNTWQYLFPVYQKLRTLLIAENKGYEGLIQRNATDSIRGILQEGQTNQYIFIGFNALNPTEDLLLSELNKLGIADFYWDYEADELKDPDNPASMFYKYNTTKFKSKHTIHTSNEKLKDKYFESVLISSAVGQAKYVNQILNQLYPADSNKTIKTALVLPDEQLLIPLLESIPAQIENINVTMGYPLVNTPIAGLFDSIFLLQRKKRFNSKGIVSFYYQNVLNILNHPILNFELQEIINFKKQEIAENNLIYISPDFFKDNDFLRILFSDQNSPVEFIEYLKEIIQQIHKMLKSDKTSNQADVYFVYQYYLTLNKFYETFKKYSYDLQLNIETLAKLIRQITSTITVPFIGEPLKGLQIMGVLETRGLDFDNLIICSFNEGKYPQKNNSGSFIPYHLRKGFQLPTFEHQDSITSYNFYRLIHHAKNIYLLTDTRSESGNSGEISRFYHQLKYYHQLEIPIKTVSFDIKLNKSGEIIISKDQKVLDKLNEFKKGVGKRHLSASSLNKYITCQLQFYFSSIEKMREENEVKELMEYDMFGTIFHKVMEEIYKPFIGRSVSETDLVDIIKDSYSIDKLINKAYKEKFYKSENESLIELEGNNLLIANILKKYIIQVLKVDKGNTPFEYLHSEKDVYGSVQTDFGDIQLMGIIDRIDKKENTIRLIDYKTGKSESEFSKIQDLFDKNKRQRQKNTMQILFYSYLMKNELIQYKIQPCVAYIRNSFKNGFDYIVKEKITGNSLIIDDYNNLHPEFYGELVNTISDIFNPELTFKQTTISENCRYCDFKTICRK